jgi:hypothetical protein
VADSWLFAKGCSSVRITRTDTFGLTVCGPGRVRRFLSFTGEADLAAYLRDTEYALVASGFEFRGFAIDRRKRAERRDGPRGLDRRGPAPW